MRQLVLVIASILLTAAAVSAVAPDYFPLQVGNVWVYRSSRGDSFQVEITDFRLAGSQYYSVARGFPGGDVWLRMGEDATLYAANPQTGQESVWAAFATPDGQSYSTSIEPCTASATMRSHALTIDAPLGHFENGLQVDYVAKCADAGLTSDVFLPYVGLLGRTATSIAGPVVWDLVYARMGNATVVTAPELSFTISLDRYAYPTGTALATARLNLRNTTGEAVALTFPSGQRFDVLVRNGKGETVYQWSKGKAFTMIFGTMQVKGEQSWSVSFPLADQAGKPLTPGNYSVEAWLASDPPDFRGRTAIEVK